jgi:hypothetical protein
MAKFTKEEAFAWLEKIAKLWKLTTQLPSTCTSGESHHQGAQQVEDPQPRDHGASLLAPSPAGQGATRRGIHHE